MADQHQLLGRNEELTQLRVRLEEARSGSTALVLLSGEAGIGKTSLVNEFAARAKEEGDVVAWGRSWEGGGAPAYWPWIQVMRSLNEHAWVQDAMNSASGGETYLNSLLSPMALEDPDQHTSDARRFALFDAVANFLRKLSQKSPLVLIFEDLHLADQSTQALIGFVAFHVRDAALLLVGTYREYEARALLNYQESFEPLTREATRVRLFGLDEDAINALLDRLSFRDLTGAEKARLANRTRGNPFYMREIVLLASHREHEASRLPDLPIPEEVRDVVRRHLELLSEEAKDFLATASVVGERCDPRWATALARISDDRGNDLLAEAEAKGVVNAGREAVYFVHSLFVETLYNDIRPTDRRRLHRDLVDILRTQSHRPVHEMAHHALKAIPLINNEEALEIVLDAARDSSDHYAYEDAERWYSAALELLPADADWRRRLELLKQLGDEQRATSRIMTARRTFRTAADLARQNEDATEFARAVLKYAGLMEMEPPVEGAIELLEEALQLLPDSEAALRIRMTAHLAVELIDAEQFQRAMELGSRALEEARRLGDQDVLLYALRGRLLTVRGNESYLDAFEETFNEMVELAKSSGDEEVELLGHAFRASYLMSFDFPAAKEEIARFAHLAHKLKMPVHLFVLSLTQSMLALWEGRLVEAERLAVEASAQLAERGVHTFDVMGNLVAQWAAWEQGRLDELILPIEEMLNDGNLVAEAVHIFQSMLAALYIDAGEIEKARRLLREIDLTHWERVTGQPMRLLELAYLTHAADALQDSSTLSFIRRLVEKDAESRAALGEAGLETLMMGGGVANRLSHLRAVLASATGDLESALPLFESALKKNREDGVLTLLARTQFEFAKALRRFEVDPERADNLLEAARGFAQELGMVPLLRRIRRIDGTVSDESQRSYVSVAEGWRVAYEGSVVVLRDTKGARYLSTLLHNPAREFHALMLLSAPSDRERSFGTLHDSGIEALKDHALGPEGEKARVSVTKALKSTINKVSADIPALGEHLRHTIRTGSYCSYRPDPASPPWQ